MNKAAIFKLINLMAHINKLLKFCGTPQKYIIYFYQSDKEKQKTKLGIMLINSHQTAIVLAVVIF